MQLMEDESVPPASQRQTALTGVSMTSALKVPLRRRGARSDGYRLLLVARADSPSRR